MKKFLKQLLGKELIALFWHTPKSMLAALINGFPARHFTVVAVAGTKGKTSTAYFISQLMDAGGIPNALFSTAALKIRSEETLNTLKLTTPTPFFFHHFLRRARKAGCTHLIVEVSSHALIQSRLWGVPFHIVCITNLAPDHLEYHKNEKEYRDTHLRLVTKYLRVLVVNGDDPHSREFGALPLKKEVLKNTDEQFARVQSTLQLKGSFNAMNAYCADSVAKQIGVPADVRTRGIRALSGAPGRMEEIENVRGFDIIVDYAHSVESLKNFFSSLRPSIRGRLIVVFGACGERDASQRAPMGRVLDENTDILVVTNDDPYSEDPESIAQQLESGITSKKEGQALFTILDRTSAIQKALSLAEKGDTVCVLGKGAEQWQVFKNKKIAWDDRQIVRKILGAH